MLQSWGLNETYPRFILSRSHVAILFCNNLVSDEMKEFALDS